MDFYATWGQACRDGRTVEQLFQAGMTGLRVNLSHVSLSRCAPALLREFRPAARRAGQPEAHLILDLQGPELRVGDLPRPVPLTPGEEVLLGAGGLPVPAAVVDRARPGQQISLDDSALLLEVTGRRGGALTCRVLRGGTLHSRHRSLRRRLMPRLPSLPRRPHLLRLPPLPRKRGLNGRPGEKRGGRPVSRSIPTA